MSRQESPSIRLADIAALCGGRLEGDPDAVIHGLASIDRPAGDRLSFLVSPRHLPDRFTEFPGCLLVRETHASAFSGNRILVPDPYLAYAQVSALFTAGMSGGTSRVHPNAVVASGSKIGHAVIIGAGAVVGRGCRIGDRVLIGHNAVLEDGCEVGDGTRIESSVTLCRRTRIGCNCVLSPGVVVGASGFGYAPDGTRWTKIHQLGGVVIGDEVDVGANTTIDRGAIDDTVIGDRVKLDNQVQIAHNVRIGDDTIIAGCTAVAGSTRIGRRCRIGGRVSILDHLAIADDVVLNAGAFVARSIPQAGTWASMIPAQPASRWRRIVAMLNRLEGMRRKSRGGGD